MTGKEREVSRVQFLTNYKNGVDSRLSKNILVF